MVWGCVKNGKIYSQREGSDLLEIIPFSENTFGFLGSRTSYEFSIKNEKKQALFKGERSSIGKEIDKAPPKEKEEIKVVPVGTNFVKTIKTRSNVAKAIKRFTRNSNFGKRIQKI